ncbi:MAG: hypothetical protein DRI95_01545 [Bacteroidetes bacterium]|nr:MAG: hypothetical protein DRI95_01545 [Bacteroidota bacterium]
MISRIKTLAFITLSLLIAYLMALQINSFLGISFKEKELPKVPKYESLIDEKTDTVQSGSLNLRLIDMGGVGIVPDSADWGHSYKHNVSRFDDVILGKAPFVDSINFARVEKEFEIYVDSMQRFDYNGIVFRGFLEFVLFDKVSSGTDIYPETSLYRARHKKLRQTFNKLFKKAQEKGLKVYLYTDMVALTPMLKNYFLKRFGKIDVLKKGFWEVYQFALEELFEEMDVDGLVIRIGEAGAIYNKANWDYSSELYVRTDESVRLMLTSFLETVEKYNKTLIFRTWSIGIGQIGDMHTNPKTYERVLKNIQSENFVVSTKYCKGDFDSYLPLNPTLEQGAHRKIAELQARREFEAFNSIPVYVAPLYQVAIQNFSAKNPNFEGVWLWAQDGGPLRSGPLSIYPFHGFNIFTDANVYAISRLLKTPSANIVNITNDWVAETFGQDSVLIDSLTKFLLKSQNVTKKGLYIKEFAQWDVRALGLEPPPMLWIFKWNIVGGGSAVMSNIYYVSKNNVDAAINEGFEAVAEAKKLKQLVESVQGRVSKNKGGFEKMLSSIDFQINLFTSLAHYRNYFLSYYQWLDTGSSKSKNNWQLALKEFKREYAIHMSKHNGNLDFPAYNFREANVGIQVADRTNITIWLSRIMLILLVLSILLGIPVLQKSNTNFPLKSLFLNIWQSLFKPWSADNIPQQKNDTFYSFIWLNGMVIGSLAIFSSGIAPVFIIVMQTSLLLYLASLFLLNRKQITQKSISLLSVLAPILVILSLLIAITAYRGPMFFWSSFWTNPRFLIGFLTLFISIILYAYYVLYEKLRKLFNKTRLQSIAQILIIQGIQFLALGTASFVASLEKSLTVINDELVVLPGGLSRILGITTHLGIPKSIPENLIIIGISLTIIGIVLSLLKQKKTIKAS